MTIVLPSHPLPQTGNLHPHGKGARAEFDHGMRVGRTPTEVRVNFNRRHAVVPFPRVNPAKIKLHTSNP